MKLKAIIATVAVVAVGAGATVAISHFASDKKADTPPVNVEQSTDDISTTEPITEPTTTPEPILLTEEEIKAKVTYACKLYDDWVGHGWAVRYDYEQQVLGEYNMPYHPVIPTEFATIGELETELQNHFAEDIYKELFEHNYLVKDDKWYVVFTIGQGGNYGLESAKLNIISNTEDKCEFTVTCNYEFYETDTYNYTLKLVDDKWIFTEYGGSVIFPYDKNPKWI